MKKIIFITAISLIAITSCKKKGCIDLNAKNYNSEAKKDDGTCTYEGSAVFWVAAATNINNELVVYVDGSKIGTMNPSTNYLYAPDCGTGGVTYYEDLGSEKSKNISYEIKYITQNPQTFELVEISYTSGTTKISGGQCVAVEIN